jgi:hypothetical protein
MASPAAAAALDAPQDPNPSRSELARIVRAALIRAKRVAKLRSDADKKRLARVPRLMALLTTAYVSLLPVRLARYVQLVVKYLDEIRQGFTSQTLECSQKTDLVMRAIYDEDVESSIQGPRDPFPIDRQFPSMPLLMHLRIRFSNSHENDGWHSLEILRIQHYEIIFMTVLKRLPLLTALLADIKS